MGCSPWSLWRYDINPTNLAPWVHPNRSRLKFKGGYKFVMTCVIVKVGWRVQSKYCFKCPYSLIILLSFSNILAECSCTLQNRDQWRIVVVWSLRIIGIISLCVFLSLYFLWAVLGEIGLMSCKIVNVDVDHFCEIMLLYKLWCI